MDSSLFGFKKRNCFKVLGGYKIMELIWKAVYTDGSSLDQYNDGKVSKYTDIDRTKLQFFELWDKDKLILRLHLEPGRRLIFRKRVEQQIMTSEKKTMFWMVGWQQTIKGENVQSINYIFEDGHVESAGAWDEKSIFYAPNLTKEEKDE
jgi:hypothetical protein